jgi:hypothetical protein
VADANFEATYTRLNERWMVTKLLSVVESRVADDAGDAAIKIRTEEVVTKAKILVKKHRDCEQFKQGTMNLISNAE